MLFRVIALACLFIIRLRFHKCLSFAAVIRKRYGSETLKVTRRFEKLDFKRRKLELDVDFLESCRRYNVLPKCLRLKVGNTNLRNSETYFNCQRKLLNEEIIIKQKNLEKINLELGTVYVKIKAEVSFLDYGHIHTTLTTGNEKSIENIKITQNKKLEKLIIDFNDQETGKHIYNFSSHVLTKAQKSLLSKGLDFAVPPKYLRDGEFLLPFELLFRDLKVSGNTSNEDLEFTKIKLNEISYSSLRSYNNIN